MPIKFRKPQNSKRYDITPVIDIDLGRKTTLNIDADIFRDKRTQDPGVLHIDNEVINNGFKTFLGEPWAYGKFTNNSVGFQLTHRFNQNWSFRSSARQYFTHEDRMFPDENPSEGQHNYPPFGTLGRKNQVYQRIGGIEW